MLQVDLLTLRKNLTKVIEDLDQTGAVEVTRYGKVVAVLRHPDEDVELGEEVLNTWTPPRPDFAKPPAPGNAVTDREDVKALVNDVPGPSTDRARRPGEYTAAEIAQIDRERLARMKKK